MQNVIKKHNTQSQTWICRYIKEDVLFVVVLEKKQKIRFEEWAQKHLSENQYIHLLEEKELGRTGGFAQIYSSFICDMLSSMHVFPSSFLLDSKDPAKMDAECLRE